MATKYLKTSGGFLVIGNDIDLQFAFRIPFNKVKTQTVSGPSIITPGQNTAFLWVQDVESNQVYVNFHDYTELNLNGIDCDGDIILLTQFLNGMGNNGVSEPTVTYVQKYKALYEWDNRVFMWNADDVISHVVVRELLTGSITGEQWNNDSEPQFVFTTEDVDADALARLQFIDTTVSPDTDTLNQINDLLQAAPVLKKKALRTLIFSCQVNNYSLADFPIGSFFGTYDNDDTVGVSRIILLGDNYGDYTYNGIIKRIVLCDTSGEVGREYNIWFFDVNNQGNFQYQPIIIPGVAVDDNHNWNEIVGKVELPACELVNANGSPTAALTVLNNVNFPIANMGAMDWKIQARSNMLNNVAMKFYLQIVVEDI